MDSVGRRADYAAQHLSAAVLYIGKKPLKLRAAEAFSFQIKALLHKLKRSAGRTAYAVNRLGYQFSLVQV